MWSEGEGAGIHLHALISRHSVSPILGTQYDTINVLQ